MMNRFPVTLALVGSLLVWPAAGAEPVSYRLNDDSFGGALSLPVSASHSCDGGLLPGPPECGPGTSSGTDGAGAADPQQLGTGRSGAGDATGAAGADGAGVGNTDLAYDEFRGRLNPRTLASGSQGEYAAFGPNTIGDMLSMPSYILYQGSLSWRADLPSGPRIKAAENNNPLPQDRIFFNYNHYHHAFQVDYFVQSSELFRQNAHLDNYTFGFEKTFLNGTCSLDVRLPVQSGIDYGEFSADPGSLSSNLGDLYIAPKVLIHSWETGALSAGVGLTFPTGGDVRGYGFFDEFQMEHNAFHVAPFVGYVSSPVEHCYLTLWGQLDFDTTGDRYTVQYADVARARPESGVVQDTAAAYASASFAWFLREHQQHRLVESLAAMVELHYSATIGSEDVFSTEPSVLPWPLYRFGSFDVDAPNQPPNGPFHILNLTAGLHYELGGGLNGRVAGVVPLTSGRDAMFPFELVVQTEWRF